MRARAAPFPASGGSGEKRSRAFLRIFRHSVDAIMVASLAVIVATMILQVVMRYVFRAALPWPEELSQYLLVLLSMLGTYRALEKDQHIRLQLLDRLRSERLVAALRLAGYACSAVFSGYVAYGGWILAQRSLTIPSTALRLPLGYVYAILPAAFALVTLALLVAMLRLVRGRGALLDDR